MIAALLISGAGLLAWGAQNTAHSEALKDWERTRIPSGRVWKYALGSRGFAPVTQPQILQRAIRKLPSTLDQDGSVWMSSDSEWITVFQGQDGSATQSVFCATCKNPPAGWEPLGIGWTGFDLAMQRIDTTIHPVQARPRPKFRDPREIQY